MRIIPVIDVRKGIVVHAVEGKRELYRPLRSLLCDSIEPLEVAKTFRSFLKVEELYLADLDAILGAKPNLELYRQIASLGFRMMVDAGVKEPLEAQRIAELGVKVVVGTETLLSFKTLHDIVKNVDPSNITLSLDLRSKELLRPIDGMKDPLHVALKAEELRVQEAIILCLDAVGTLRGVDLKLVERVKKGSKLNLLVGGGVRSLEDIKKLKEISVTGVLLATALHTGLIKLEDLKSLRL